MIIDSELKSLQRKGRLVELPQGHYKIASSAGRGLVRFPIGLKYKPMSTWMAEEKIWTNM